MISGMNNTPFKNCFNSRKIFLGCLIFGQLINISCGIRNKDEPLNKPLSVLHQKTICHSENSLNSPNIDNFYQEIDESYERWLKLSNQKGIKNFQNYQVNSYTPETPLNISKSLLKQEWNKLIKSSKKTQAKGMEYVLGSINFEDVNDSKRSFLILSEQKNFNQFLNIYKKKERLVSQSCQSEKQYSNSRIPLKDYLLFRNEHCTSLYQTCKFDEDAWDRHLFMKFCRIDRTKAFCRGLMKFSSKKKLKEKFHVYLENFEKKEIQSLFQVENPRPFNCQKADDSWVLEIPLLNEDHKRWEIELERALKVWKRKDFEIKLVQVDDPDHFLRIQSSNESVSKVMTNDQKLVMKFSVDGGQRQKVFTHEWGHILGFPDCYIENWHHHSGKKGELEYFELTSDNVMCSLKASKLPDVYFDELIKSYCL